MINYYTLYENLNQDWQKEFFDHFRGGRGLLCGKPVNLTVGALDCVQDFFMLYTWPPSTVCIVYSEALTLYSVRGYNEEKGSRSYVTG